MIDSYSFELYTQLETTVASYEEDRQKYWEDLGGWSAVRYEQAERFAQAVLKNSEQLIHSEEIDGDLSELQSEINRVNQVSEDAKRRRIDDIVNMDIPWDERKKLLLDEAKDWPPDPQEDESLLKLVWERFIIDMSLDAIEKIVGGASRIVQLYQFVLNSTPSESTQRFLGRVSRCYIWGFEPECVILCRAVIDTAFNKKVTYEMCKKYPSPDNKSPFTLENRIEVAQKEGFIDKDIAKKAHSVRLRGNTAIHEQPDAIKDVWGTIRDTVAVLKTIT